MYHYKIGKTVASDDKEIGLGGFTVKRKRCW